ncbi:Membrane lipoprotein TmpC precursor [Pseudovibrio sp. W64]|uniref:Nucleoside-binding protein n=1 Tax=Pseudovibrio ascidiaceicola TaxID=285279 RepID=A0A1I3YXB1_9HYPH|nr:MULTISPECIES: BMP family ABC transporter substrate-binding protein [Pseudovibrio]KZK75468.1 Membrane lipoprotein TmpC precursor [Pseudovibrio sp. W64]SFK35999.1 nucleoside-binding protein [Pseudovibrio ascidiaceicola]
MKTTTILGAVALAAVMTTGAMAETFKPAVVYDFGGRNDRSFNEAAYKGALQFEERTGIKFRDFEIQNPSQREQALRNFARRGLDPIITIGFAQAAALEKVAKEFPDTHFAIVDSVVDLPNVRSIVFKEGEGSFLVGLLAAMSTESDTIGFVGGMDIPLIRKFACGYKQGAKYAKPDIEIIENMTGTTGAAWTDPLKGGELARSQFARGADVVFHAAGLTGTGVLQAAADEGKLGIGVDSNQNHLHPGSVLTSMIKAVDVAVDKTLTDAKEGKWTSGVEVLGLAENGVSWSYDEYNKPLITAEMQSAVEQAKMDIISGKVEVHDYMVDSSCPF